MAYFMPDLATVMDMSREVTGITGMELPVKDSNSDEGMLVSDVFLNVPVIGGEDWDVACLVEQQHEPDKDFAGRIFGSWIRLRASRPTGRTTVFAIYTGGSKDVNFYTETCFGFEASIKFRTFYLPSYSVERLREDKRPFARVMYAGRLSLGTENDIALRERYALEILNTTDEGKYDNRQRKFILEFADRIFRLSDPKISQKVREAYKMKTVSLEQYVAEIDKAEARMEGMEKGMEKGKFEVARNFLKMGLPLDQIAQGTGLSVEEISVLR
ncbi:MAG: hypothetical protein LBS00_10205 [Synergistaceae bacterium]|nr:hypothetical protein [Synergistaceae bacterium]